MKINKKILIVIVLFITILNTGCWNYIGLNEMTVVAGVAIDKEGDNYLLSYEIYDLQSTADGFPIVSQIVQSTGKTIFDAVRNAKKRVANKLYFSDAKVIIVSKEIAQNDGIESILNWFVRDPEIREVLQLVVSEEESALALLKTNGLASTIVSNDIKAIIEKDESTTGSTEALPIYKIYNILNSSQETLTLPVIHLANNNGDYVCEINGIAVFKNDKLVNYLSAEETKYYLLAKNKLKGGIITINTKIKNDDENSQNISLEIKNNSSSIEYISTDENNLKIKITTNTEVILGELKNQTKKLTNEDLIKLQKEAQKVIKQKIEEVVSKIQNDYGVDILGFENVLYKSNYQKWEKLKNNFDDLFKNIKIEVESKVKIFNTGFTK